MNRDLKYRNVSVTIIICQCTVRTCGEKEEAGWTTGSSANEYEAHVQHDTKITHLQVAQ
jgi:hypothetical protein